MKELLLREPHFAVPQGSASLLRDLIHEKAGIFYDEANYYLMIDKLEPLVMAKKFVSLIDYYFFLKDRPHYSEDWRRVMDALSVQETYFWREMDQIRAVVNILVPAWFSRSNDLLRIWVAACATGEEAFTIVMALDEAGFGHHPIQIVASDASEAALQKARSGIYRERSFRATPPEIRAKFFKPSREHWLLNPELLSRVRFERVNLVVRAETSELACSPIIFCRNVFIYFSQEVIARTVRSFAERMPPGAHLCVAASESLLKLTGDFDLQEIGNAFIYVRKPQLTPWLEK
ncbi:MAG: protein-glutamate O-methyltransferase CheR [Verrucomicrobiota bacterium]